MFLKAGNTIVTLDFITYYLPFTKMQNKLGSVKGGFTFAISLPVKGGEYPLK